MGKPAARLTDFHVCPMMTPGVPPIPHVGGPIAGPGNPTVLIGKLPAAVMGDMCVCVGPPDSIVLGSMGVMIGKKPAARMGDSTAHGGAIMLGCPTVLIGESSGGGGAASPVVVQPIIAALKIVMTELREKYPAVATQIEQQVTLLTAAVEGTPFCEVCSRS